MCSGSNGTVDILCLPILSNSTEVVFVFIFLNKFRVIILCHIVRTLRMVEFYNCNYYEYFMHYEIFFSLMTLGFAIQLAVMVLCFLYISFSLLQ